MKVKNIFLALILFSTTLFAQSVRIGVVDSETILSQLPEYQNAQTKLNEIIKSWQDVLDSLTQSYQSKIESYRKQEALMPEEKKLSAQQELVKLEQDILAFRQKKFGQQGELNAKQEELLAPIKKKIINVIEKVAKEEKLNMVLDKAGDVVVLYA
ncbi:MAG: OmpH family outer membrane protein, partial [Ignavibacteria bacterium]|nr:OmpH family outer membrane protein [Ignavibacteria bacterium]